MESKLGQHLDCSPWGCFQFASVCFLLSGIKSQDISFFNVNSLGGNPSVKPLFSEIGGIWEGAVLGQMIDLCIGGKKSFTALKGPVYS